MTIRGITQTSPRLDSPPELLRLAPKFVAKPWGGHVLTGGSERIGESWLFWGGSVVSGGAWDGIPLSEVATVAGCQFLGDAVYRRFGAAIPFVLKILDVADWISIQVHPDDRSAARIEHNGHTGKREAWYVLRAEPEARIIIGVRPGVDITGIIDAAAVNELASVAEYATVEPGMVAEVPAKTLHALGPGILALEVQQASDITYRLWDWNRDRRDGHQLDTIKALASLDPARKVTVRRDYTPAGMAATLVDDADFQMASFVSPEGYAHVRMDGASFHVIVVTEGRVTLTTPTAQLSVAPFEAIVLSADVRECELESGQPFRAVCIAPTGAPSPRDQVWLNGRSTPSLSAPESLPSRLQTRR